MALHLREFRPHIARLAAAQEWTYGAGGGSRSEPAAWAAIALAAHGEFEAARRPAQWLGKLQQNNGSVGLSPTNAEPRWPTALALLAWRSVDRWNDVPEFSENAIEAISWSLADRGRTAPHSPEVGHDTMLVGWSWATNTHSWLEPTAMYVMGLKAAGEGRHARVREGVRLVVDRLLPEGGANYGNTTVFGQILRPHVEPTGLALAALAGEEIDDGRVGKSIAFLLGAVGDELAPQSLGYALLGLAAQKATPDKADEWIINALSRKRPQPLPEFETALLLAAAAPVDWLGAAAVVGSRPKELAR